ncbi:MAG: BatD family protein [Bacteroidales bacterium]|nr:BatD family protein [Bacteroidales bacterium]
MKRIIHILLFILGTASMAQAQDVQFKASAPKQVTAGQRFQLTYSVNAEASDFSPPDFEGFRILSGPNQSSSSSIQIINGKMNRSVNYEFSYWLVAREPGTHTIPPAKVKAEGEAYESNPLTIRVTGSSQGTSPQGQQQQKRQHRQTEEPDVDDDIFIRATVNNKNPYLGEEVIITYKLYTRVNIADHKSKSEPAYPGFWVQSLTDQNSRANQYYRNIKGHRYLVAEIRYDALYPQKTGELTTEPLEMEIMARVKKQQRSRRSFFDDFFDSYDNVRLDIASNPVTIDVKPLPMSNRPASFNGAVGKYNFSSSINKKQVKTNEAINLNFSVRGSGNIKLLEEPDIKFPPDFEVYDPEINSNINKSVNQGISGTKTFEYTIIPRMAGNYSIGPVTFTYFDPVKEKYISQSAPEFEIEVTKGTGGAPGTTYSGTSQEDIQYLSKDIRFLKTPPFNWQRQGAWFIGSGLFYILLAIPVLGILIALLVRYEQKRRSREADFIKTRKATKVARKHLKFARKKMKANEEDMFYEAVLKALWVYLGDRFNIPQSELSGDKAVEILSNHQVSHENIDELTDIINQCEFARYAPGDKDYTMERVYQRALAVITRIEKELK